MQSRKDKLTLRVLTAGLLITALIFCQGCTTESEDIPTGPAVTVDVLITEGWTYLNDGMVDDALAAFQEAANAEASNLEAYLGLGYAFAEAQEPIAAMGNLSNVLSLGEVMLANDDLSQEYADTLFAEACAGRASVALSTEDYEMAIEEAQAARVYWASFAVPEHRWMSDFSSNSVTLVEANAWYGLEEYGEVMVLLDDLSGNTFIADLMTNLIISQEPNEVVEVTLLEETEHSGVAKLDLANLNLIYPSSVVKDGIEYEVVDYNVGFDEVWFKANPIPAAGDQYTVDYYYAADFGRFLIELLNELNG